MLKDKVKKFKCEELIDNNEEYGLLINYDELTFEEKEELIAELDFKLNKNAVREHEYNDEEDLGKPCWKLIDLQEANLGGIEDEEWEPGNIDLIMDRLGAYYHDYGFYFTYELEELDCEYQILEENWITINKKDA